MSQRKPEHVLRRLEWTVVRRLDGLLQGDYRTLFRGFGLDLADLREYQYYDDVRHIDWNVTARLQVPHVRQFHEDREVRAWFLVDVSASMDLASGARSKRACAAECVAVLARVLTRHGNRVGALLFDEGVSAAIPARGGRRQVLHLLQRIDAGVASPRQAGAAADTDLAATLRAALRLIGRRSLVFVVSDFLARPGWEGALGHLARRHEIVAVRLIDPTERELPELGLAVLEDAETGEQMTVDVDDARLRERFAARAAAREAALIAALSGVGVDTMELATDDDLVGAIVAFADARRRRGRTGGAARPGTPARPGAADALRMA